MGAYNDFLKTIGLKKQKVSDWILEKCHVVLEKSIGLGYIVRGGWPANIDVPVKQAALLPGEYLSAVIKDDVYRIDGVKRDVHKMELLLRSLARNESTTITNKKLKNDIKEIDDEDIR